MWLNSGRGQSKISGAKKNPPFQNLRSAPEERSTDVLIWGSLANVEPISGLFSTGVEIP